MPVRLAATVAMLVVVASACGDDTDSSTVGSEPVITSPGTEIATSTETEIDTTTTSAPPATTATTAAETTPGPIEDLDVIVSASVAGGMIQTLGVAQLAVVGGSGPDDPWATFDLVLNYCCGAQDTVVFSRAGETWTWEGGDPPQLRVEGPACSDVVLCGDDERRATSEVQGTALHFRAFRGGDGLDPLRPGSLTVEVPAVFDFEHPSLTDDPMLITLRFDISPATPDPAGPTTPVSTPTARVSVVGGGFDLLPFPFVAAADDEAALQAILAGAATPVDASTLAIDWTVDAAVVLSIPTDLCPPVLADVEVVDGAAEPVFVNPGYFECPAPLLSHTVIAAVDRTHLRRAATLVLPADEPFFDDPVSVALAIAPPTGVRPAPATAAPPLGDVRGRVELPRRGDIAVAILDDGAPVFVLHHHDGTVSALDPRAGTRPGGPLDLVHWVARTRTFLAGPAAWDEYGRRSNGFRTSDLRAFATRVETGVVEIGGLVASPVGSPITRTGDPPAVLDVQLDLTSPIALDAALALPPGATAVIDADLVVGPEGALVCASDHPPTPARTLAPCPEGSPVAEQVEPTPGNRTWWLGPLVATRTPGGFERIGLLGGYAGGSV